METGRQHQIRRHLKWLAHPVIGDATYGKGNLNRALYEYFGISRMLLHCALLKIQLPGAASLAVQAPLDDEFKNVLDRMGWLENYKADIDALS